MNTPPTSELLAQRARHEATLATPFDDNVGDRIAAINAIKAIDRELDRRAPRIFFDREGHDRFMRAVLTDGYALNL